MCNTSQRKVAGDSESAHCRVPRHGASAKSLPADGESTEYPRSNGESTGREKSYCSATPRYQANGDSADAHRCDGNAPKGEEQAESSISTGDPRLDRSLLSG